MTAKHLTGVVILATATLACQGPPGGAESIDALPEMPGFSWVIDSDLAAMPRPGGFRALEEDLNFLADQEIAVLVSLTIDPIDPTALAARGIDGRHIPVVDFTAPTLDQMSEFVDLVADTKEAGARLGVHCTGGLGRSGTMSAANFVSLGFSPADAIAEIRELRPGSIETASQEQAIFDFAAR